MNVAVLATLAFLAIANVAMTVLILRSSAYQRRQKLLQLLLIWLVPVLGPVIVWSFLRGIEGQRVATPFPERSDYSVLPPDHVNLNGDAADIGGLGGSHGGN